MDNSFDTKILKGHTMGNNPVVMKPSSKWRPHTKTRKPNHQPCTPRNSTQWFSLFSFYFFLSSSDSVELRSVAETKCNISTCKFKILLLQYRRRSDNMGRTNHDTPYMEISFGITVLEGKSMWKNRGVIMEHGVFENAIFCWAYAIQFWKITMKSQYSWKIDLIP